MTEPEPELLLWMLRRAARRFAGAVADRLSTAGAGDISPRGTWAIQTLHERDRSARELVDIMQISKQAVSTLVEELVAKGYVERFPDASDRRRTGLRLTDQGRAAATVIADTCRAVEADLASELGPDQIDHLRRTLTALDPRRPHPVGAGVRR